jgi:hypothetical protein
MFRYRPRGGNEFSLPSHRQLALWVENVPLQTIGHFGSLQVAEKRLLAQWALHDSSVFLRRKKRIAVDFLKAISFRNEALPYQS